MSDSWANELALKLIDELRARKGFDWWFDDLDATIQDEIIEDLRNVILTELQ